MGPGISLERKFDLDAGTGILSGESAGSLEVSLRTDADVVRAIESNSPFPLRDGKPIELGRIQLEADGGKDVVFDALKAKVRFSASAAAGMGIYNDAASAAGSLRVQDVPAPLSLELPAPAGWRYLVMSCGYEVEGAASATHPIGALGTLTFGVEGRRQALYAVLHGFPADAGAHDVLRGTIGSWKLPRQVAEAGQLAPATWLIAETDGRLAVNLAAQLGYDFSFVRELNGIGLSGDVGFKIDAAVKATFGFEVSGRYLLVLGREDPGRDSQRLRLRLFKLSKKGHNFGLNLNLTVKGITDALPDSVDDLVKAVFGVHGRQVVKDLQAIEAWTDKDKDLSDTVAGLVNQTGLDLLKRTTGIDPRDDNTFRAARDKALAALRVWDQLPERAAGATWNALERIARLDSAGQGEVALKTFRDAIDALAKDDPAARAHALAGMIVEAANQNGLDLPVRDEWLSAIAERGLLSLMDRLDEVHQTASTVAQVLDGGFIRELQGFINERLNLDAIRKAVTQADFEHLDAWLVKRLSQFLDQQLGFDQLESVKNLINTVIRKRQEVYAAAKKALAGPYSMEIAAAYAKTTEKTAVLDAEFDLAQEEAKAMLRTVLADGNLDELLVKSVAGLKLREALLTHGVNRATSVEVNMPFLSYRRDHINESLAKVHAEEDGGRVLIYELAAEDTVAVRNRLKSQLAVSGAFPTQANQVRLRDASSLRWNYRLLAVRENMRRSELEVQIAPFIQRYLPDQFPAGGAASLETWITDFDRAVEDVTHNGTDEFGDVLLDMQVSVPASALRAWFRARSKDQLRSDSMEISRRIQASLKDLLPFYHLQDVSRLRQNAPVAALLVWASIPPCTGANFANGKLTVNTGQDPYWNFPDPDLRHAMATSSLTTERLAPLLAAARMRLLANNDKHNADFFVPGETVKFQSLAATAGDTQLQTLVFFEAEVIRQACDALNDISEFMAKAGGAPSEAIERLAAMGAAITEAFHGKISSVYGGEALRAVGSLVFLEASRALDPAQRNTLPSALLRIIALQEQRTFAMPDYLKGLEPARQDVALVQTLASVVN